MIFDTIIKLFFICDNKHAFTGKWQVRSWLLLMTELYISYFSANNAIMKISKAISGFICIEMNIGIDERKLQTQRDPIIQLLTLGFVF